MSNIADDINCRLHIIANLLNNKDALNVVNDFRNWERFKGKLRNWFIGTGLLPKRP